MKTVRANDDRLKAIGQLLQVCDSVSGWICYSGTIAMMFTGHDACALRKMFVKKEYRGKEIGAAQKLLDVLLDDCRKKGITDVYLGTVDMLKAAHRFYERNGFERQTVEELPIYFPRMMADNVYFHLQVKK